MKKLIEWVDFKSNTNKELKYEDSLGELEEFKDLYGKYGKIVIANNVSTPNQPNKYTKIQLQLFYFGVNLTRTLYVINVQRDKDEYYKVSVTIDAPLRLVKKHFPDVISDNKGVNKKPRIQILCDQFDDLKEFIDKLISLKNEFIK